MIQPSETKLCRLWQNLNDALDHLQREPEASLQTWLMAKEVATSFIKEAEVEIPKIEESVKGFAESIDCANKENPEGVPYMEGDGQTLQDVFGGLIYDLEKLLWRVNRAKQRAISLIEEAELAIYERETAQARARATEEADRGGDQ